jgi:hypothetical protein
MNLSIEQFCNIMEREGIPIVERYRLLFALKEYDGYVVDSDGSTHHKKDLTLTEDDIDKMFENLTIYAKTCYVAPRIKVGELPEPDSLFNI